MREDPAVRHEWVRALGLTIDVTADQFDRGPRIVCKRHSRWHLYQFSVLETRNFNPDFLNDFHEYEADDLLLYYREFELKVDQLQVT